METFISIPQRKINIEGFSNQDTLSKSEFDLLVSKGVVEVYTQEGIDMYLKKINSTLEKSDDSEKETLKKSIDEELSLLKKHRVEGKVIFLKLKKPDVLEKGEEIIQLEVNDIIKSSVTEAFNYGSLSKVEFSKKGSDLKTEINKSITNLSSEKEDIKTKMAVLVATLPVKPDRPASDYQYKGMKGKIGDIFSYSYDMCYFREEQPTNNYDSLGTETKAVTPTGPESAEQAKLYDFYNDLAYQYICRCVDIEYLKMFTENLDDKKNYQLTIPQMVDLGIEKSEENDIEKGGEGSKGGKVIGHTKSGKPVYENSISSKGKYRGFSKKDHEDAVKLHATEKDKYDSNTDRDSHTHHKVNATFHEIESNKK